MAVNLPDVPPAAVVPAAIYALARMMEASTPLVRTILQHRRARTTRRTKSEATLVGAPEFQNCPMREQRG